MVNPSPPASPAAETARPWYRQLNSYHWLVLIVATMAWSFDCLNQQIFNLTRKPAMDALSDHAGQRRLLRSFEHHCPSDWLGNGRHHLRHPGRPHRPGQDVDDHDPLLQYLHGIVRAFHRAVGLYPVLLHYGRGRRGESSPFPARWWPKACPIAPVPRPWAWCRPFPPSETSGPG